MNEADEPSIQTRSRSDKNVAELSSKARYAGFDLAKYRRFYTVFMGRFICFLLVYWSNAKKKME